MGRITDCTPELTEKFAGLIRAGNYFETACNYLGIDKKSAYNWIKWGEEGRDAHGSDPDAYRRFFHAFVQAESEAEVGAVALLKQAGRAHRLPDNLLDPDGKPLPGVQYGDWRATAEYLARRHRDRWSPNARTEVVGAGGGALQVEHEGDALEQLSGAIARLAARGAEDGDPEQPDAGAGE